MKRLLFMIAPVLILMLAFRPVTYLTITGKVTDETGNPLPGVSITVIKVEPLKRH